MDKLETKKKFWQQKWLPWAVIVALALIIGGLGWRLSATQEQQKSMEEEMQVQNEAIESLRKQLGKNKKDEDTGVIHEADPVITNNVVSERLNSLQELVTSEYIYTNAGKYENNNQATVLLWELNVPFTEKSFLVAYDGRIRAGVDLSKAKITINEDNQTIAVILPKSTIISHETFEDSLAVLDEKSNVFNPISISDFNEFVGTQKTNMEITAIERGVLTNASADAKQIVQSYLSLIPGMDKYTLIIMVM